MEQFEKWQGKREVKTIGWLNNSSAYKAGEKAGWREALEWVRNLPLQKDGPSNPTCLIACINKELGDT